MYSTNRRLATTRIFIESNIDYDTLELNAGTERASPVLLSKALVPVIKKRRIPTESTVRPSQRVNRCRRDFDDDGDGLGATRSCSHQKLWRMKECFH